MIMTTYSLTCKADPESGHKKAKPGLSMNAMLAGLCSREIKLLVGPDSEQRKEKATF